MKPYLRKVLDWKNPKVANVYDELPLWSAPFGLLLLKHIPIIPYERVLDVAFGTGFPMFELAQRLGPDCEMVGIDNWKAAVERARQKKAVLGINQVSIIESDASSLPFSDNYFDLITSNLGVNNFEEPTKVINACFRVLKPGASLCITSNLTGTFDPFFQIFQETLLENGWSEYLEPLQHHIDHRGTVDSLKVLFEKGGFTLKKVVEDRWTFRLLNGTAFLNHALIIMGFMDSWRNLFETDYLTESVFAQLETNLNRFASEQNGLELTIPMVYMEWQK